MSLQTNPSIIVTSKYLQGQGANGRMDYKGHEGTLAMFDSLTVMTAVWVCTSVKIHHLYILTYEF